MFSPVNDDSCITSSSNHDYFPRNENSNPMNGNRHYNNDNVGSWNDGKVTATTAADSHTLVAHVPHQPSTGTRFNQINNNIRNNSSNNGDSGSINSGGSSNSLSLLERIQQAKKQKHSYVDGPDSSLMQHHDVMNTPPFPNHTTFSSTEKASFDPDAEFGFGYSREDEEDDDDDDDIDNHHDKRSSRTLTLPETLANGNIQRITIPDYSASDNIRNDHWSSSYNDYDGSGGNNDRGYKVLNALTTVKSAFGSMAKTAFHGTRHLYHTVIMMNNNSNSNSNSNTNNQTSQRRMHEMDYQRESLLLDPHEMEDGTMLPMEQASPLGLRSQMMGSSSNNVSVGTGSHPLQHHRCHTLIGCLIQFCVDVRDIFMGLSRNKKLVVIAFVVFLVWLFVSEERQQHHHSSSQ
jgi:hypothetical protein